MNIVQVKVNRYIQESSGQEDLSSAMVPVVIPEIEKVRSFALQLHARGQTFKDNLWGWPVQYDPEINEEAAEFQVPTTEGGYYSEFRPFWSPASFTIGESGVWFFSLLWENGIDQPPVEFLDQQNILLEDQFEQGINLYNLPA